MSQVFRMTHGFTSKNLKVIQLQIVCFFLKLHIHDPNCKCIHAWCCWKPSATSADNVYSLPPLG